MLLRQASRAPHERELERSVALTAQTRLTPVAGVYRMAAVRKNEQHVVGLAAATFHSGRASRHARDCKASRFRALLEQALDFPRWHVALDCVAFDDGGVAAAQRVRYAEARPVGFGILHILGLHTEAVCPQMVDPRAAAPSGCVLVDGDGFRSMAGEGREHQRRSKKNRAQHRSHDMSPFLCIN